MRITASDLWSLLQTLGHLAPCPPWEGTWDRCYSHSKRKKLRLREEPAAWRPPAGLGLETRHLYPRFTAFTAASGLFNYCQLQRAEVVPNPSVCPEIANMVLGMCRGSGSWVLKAEEVGGLPCCAWSGLCRLSWSRETSRPQSPLPGLVTGALAFNVCMVTDHPGFLQPEEVTRIQDFQL